MNKVSTPLKTNMKVFNDWISTTNTPAEVPLLNQWNIVFSDFFYDDISGNCLYCYYLYQYDWVMCYHAASNEQTIERKRIIVNLKRSTKQTKNSKKSKTNHTCRWAFVLLRSSAFFSNCCTQIFLFSLHLVAAALKETRTGSSSVYMYRHYHFKNRYSYSIWRLL